MYFIFSHDNESEYYDADSLQDIYFHLTTFKGWSSSFFSSFSDEIPKTPAEIAILVIEQDIQVCEISFPHEKTLNVIHKYYEIPV